jgi:hypothetical protein
MSWNNILFLIVGFSIGMCLSLKYCGDSTVKSLKVDSLDAVIFEKDQLIKAKTSENVKLAKEVSKYKCQKDSLILLQLKSTVFYKGLSKQEKIYRFKQIDTGIVQINDSVVQLSMSAIDTINLLRIDNEYKTRQLKVSDKIISVQDSIINNDSITIMSYQSIRGAQNDIIQTQKKEIKKLRFQKTIAIISGGIVFIALLLK